MYVLGVRVLGPPSRHRDGRTDGRTEGGTDRRTGDYDDEDEDEMSVSLGEETDHPSRRTDIRD